MTLSPWNQTRLSHGCLEQRYKGIGTKVDQISQPKMGQIWDFFQYIISETDRFSPRFVPFGANLAKFCANPYIPGVKNTVHYWQ